MYRWFPDGITNICYNCIDRHVQYGDGDKTALIYDSGYLGISEKWTYNDLLERVGRFANVLKKKFSIQKGDRVLLYMPMIPVSVFAMLACARIGAIHSVVFGGFAAKELANRIDDCKPKVIITASCGLEPGKVIPYRPIVDEAFQYCEQVKSSEVKRILIQRKDKHEEKGQDKKLYFDYDDLMADEKDICPCEFVESTHPLYILYTSGTTGAPKGTVRDTGGTAVGLSYIMDIVFDIQKGDTYFAASDIGWVVGHSFIVYGPLLRGAQTVLFEGKPTVPNVGVLWRVVA